MPAPALGSVNFSILRGIPSLIRPRVDTWEVPGLDGYGAQTLGQGEGEFDCVGIGYWADNDTADGHIFDCSQLQGTLVTMIDEWGNSTAGVLVVRADTNGAVKKGIVYLGNAAAVRTEIRFRLIATQ